MSMTHTNNPDTWEAETGESVQSIPGQPELYYESQASLDYTVRFSFNAPTIPPKSKKNKGPRQE